MYLSASVVTTIITSLVLISITNFNFTIYHLYMRKKSELKNRLLNVLYSFHASLLQFGSFLMLLIICDSFTYKDPTRGHEVHIHELLITIRMFHLSCVFLNIFNIGIATFIQHFKMSFYLQISVKMNTRKNSMLTFLLSTLINIFVRSSYKEKNDVDLASYQNIIKGMCLILSFLALLMCLAVLTTHISSFLKNRYLALLRHARDYYRQKRASVTPMVTVAMEEIQVDNINNNNIQTPAESNNSNNSSVATVTVITPILFTFEDHIRLVVGLILKVYSQMSFCYLSIKNKILRSCDMHLICFISYLKMLLCSCAIYLIINTEWTFCHLKLNNPF